MGGVNPGGVPVHPIQATVVSKVEAALAASARMAQTLGDQRIVPENAGAARKMARDQKIDLRQQLDQMVCRPKTAIWDWVTNICQVIATNVTTQLHPAELKALVFNTVAHTKKIELNYLAPGSPAIENDSVAEYVGRIAALFEPELFSPKHQQEYLKRKQLKYESATSYLSEKWILYERAEPNPDWARFLREAFTGLSNQSLKAHLGREKEMLFDKDTLHKRAHWWAATLRDEAEDQGKELTGLFLDPSALVDRKHLSDGTIPMQVNEVGMEEQGETVVNQEVAVVSVKECWTCKQPGHLAADCPKGGAKKKVIKTKKQGDYKCLRCNQTGHFARDCGVETSRPKCSFCGRLGHVEADCRQKKKPAVF